MVSTPTQLRRTRILAAASLGLLFLLAAQSASATPIQIHFEGHLQQISSGLYPLSIPIFTGEPVSGFVEFDPEGAIDLNSDPNYGEYFDVVTQLRIQIGEFTFESTGLGNGNQVLVHDYSPSADIQNKDVFVARTPVSGPSISGFSPERAQFGLSGLPHESILASEAILTAAQLRQIFVAPQRNLNSIRLVNATGELRFLGFWVSKIRVVPEPGTALLLMIGLAGLAGTRRRS